MTSSLYSNKVVAFVDILGFSSFISGSLTDTNIMEKISKALDEVVTVRPKKAKLTGLQSSSFSDNIVLSADDTYDGLEHLCMTVDRLFNRLLLQGVMVRGGITIGKLYHDEKKVFGPALIEAHRMEETLAVFPRVIVSHKFMKGLAEYTKPTATTNELAYNFYSSRLARDNDDGIWYLHILNYYQSYCSGDKPAPNIIPKIENDMSSVKDFIQYQIQATVDNPKVYQKYIWFGHYWNRHCYRGKVNAPASNRIRFPGEAIPQTVLPFTRFTGDPEIDDNDES